MDVKSAFRLMSMHQGEFDLLGFKIGNRYFIGKYLIMGCSVSCSHFERFSSFLHWVTEMESCLHEINKFIIVDGPSVLSSAIGTPNCEQTSVKVFINFEQLLVLSAPANNKSSR
jgi:hypothetical protein